MIVTNYKLYHTNVLAVLICKSILTYLLEERPYTMPNPCSRIFLEYFVFCIDP